MLKDFPNVNVVPSANTVTADTDLQQLSTAELAQILLTRLSISDKDWHRLKSNRSARASEQVAAALVFLLKDQPDEAIARLHQATGWLDRSISAPPCEHRTAAKPPQ